MDPHPPLCANGCGFSGSVQNRNLCSKCFKQYQKELLELANSVPIAVAGEEFQALTIHTKTSTSNAALASTCTKIKRCNRCNNKVELMGFPCRCGHVFCGKHLYPEEHGCGFDFKAVGREILDKQNPLCKADKLRRRI